MITSLAIRHREQFIAITLLLTISFLMCVFKVALPLMEPTLDGTNSQYQYKIQLSFDGEIPIQGCSADLCKCVLNYEECSE